MTEKTNDNSKMGNIVPVDDTNNLPEIPGREEKFIRNLWLYKTAKEAALKAGYSEYTASSTIYVKMKTERFRNKIREYAVANDLMALPKIHYIENKVLDYLMDNPLETGKHKHILREKKRIAGVLSEDTPRPAPVTINVKEIRLLHAGLLPTPEDAEDAEIIDTK